MTRFFVLAALAAPLLIGVCEPARLSQPAVSLPQDMPALTGRVVDEADLLTTEDEQALSDLSARLEAKTTDQFVIVTVRSLGGQSIEDYGLALGRSWGIGQRDANNGVLLIVAPNDRRVRIEVGYGLEGLLTDERAARIIGDRIVPAFRRGDFRGGIKSGAEGVVEVLEGDLRPRPLARPGRL